MYQEPPETIGGGGGGLYVGCGAGDTELEGAEEELEEEGEGAEEELEEEEEGVVATEDGALEGESEDVFPALLRET